MTGKALNLHAPLLKPNSQSSSLGPVTSEQQYYRSRQSSAPLYSDRLTHLIDISNDLSRPTPRVPIAVLFIRIRLDTDAVKILGHLQAPSAHSSPLACPLLPA